MKISFALGLLFRSLLLTSFSSLLACSSVLQATRLSKSFPPPPAEPVADVSAEAVAEQALFMDDTQRLDAEATHDFPRSIASGYRWVFIVKEGARNTPGLGHWVIKPNN